MARTDYSRSTLRLSSLWLHPVLDKVLAPFFLSLTIFRTFGPRQKRKSPQDKSASNFLTAILSHVRTAPRNSPPQKQPAGTFHSWFAGAFMLIESFSLVPSLVESRSQHRHVFSLTQPDYRHAIIFLSPIYINRSPERDLVFYYKMPGVD